MLLKILKRASGKARSAAAPEAGRETRYDFRIVRERAQGQTLLIADNNGPAPVFVSASFTRQENIGSDRPWPLSMMAAPRGRTVLARLFAADPDLPFAYEYQYRWSVGPAESRHDGGAAYLPPFPAGMRFPVTQGEGGERTSHAGLEGWHAVDLGMPRGTPILCARDGLVFEAEDGFGEGQASADFLERANLVRVLHADGTIAEYVHLLKGSVAVEPGQRVRAGERLGLSGNSGYSTGPHLHFGVQRKSGHDFISIPFEFVTSARGRFAPRFGEEIAAD